MIIRQIHKQDVRWGDRPCLPRRRWKKGSSNEAGAPLTAELSLFSFHIPDFLLTSNVGYRRLFHGFPPTIKIPGALWWRDPIPTTFISCSAERHMLPVRYTRARCSCSGKTDLRRVGRRCSNPTPHPAGLPGPGRLRQGHPSGDRAEVEGKGAWPEKDLQWWSQERTFNDWAIQLWEAGNAPPCKLLQILWRYEQWAGLVILLFF